MREGESLTKAITQLDAANERTNSAQARTAAMAAKEKLATILEAKSDPAKLAARLKAISGDMEQLGKMGTDVVLSARDDVERKSRKSSSTLRTLGRTTIESRRRISSGRGPVLNLPTRMAEGQACG